MHRLRRAFSVAPWLASAFLIALALTLFFGIRAITGAIYWADPSHRDQEIAGWMTPRYVAMSWQVPPEVIVAALNLPRPEGRMPRLEDIAADRNTTVAALSAELQAAIAAYRAAQ